MCVRVGLLVALLLAANACLAAPPDSAPVPDEHTLLLWHFDEGEGERTADASAHGFDGTLTGAEWVEGRFGSALRWGEENGQVRGSRERLEIHDRFTLQCWIKLDQYPTGTIPFWASDICGKLGSFIMTVRPPGVLYVGVQLGPTGNYMTGHIPIPLGEWTHVALVYDGPARKIGTLVNGELDLQVDVPADQPPVSFQDDRAFTARSYNGSDEKLMGAIDEVCLTDDVRLFGHQWSHSVHLHALRYTSELMLVANVPPVLENPPVSYHLTVTRADGTEAVAADVTLEQARGGAAVPVALPDGDYHAMVTCTSADGSVSAKWDRDMYWGNPDKSVYDFRADNVLLREGKPLFPIVAYHVRQEDLGIVADSAINVANCWTSTMPPDYERDTDGRGYVEACGKHGLMAVASGGAMYAPGMPERVGAHYRGNRDLLFYYVADEPHGPGRQPEDMLRIMEGWHRWDPSHPTFLLQNTVAEFTRYCVGGDIFATDSYPLRKPEDTNMWPVATWTRAAVEAVRWRKPVWIALQCYTVRSTEEATRSRDLRPPLPTPDQLRCASYMALCEGARGLLYYAFDDTYYQAKGIRGVNIAKEFPEFWDGMKRVLAEIASHAEIWTAPYADLPEPTCSNEKVMVQRRPYAEAGKLYVLVVNPEPEAQTAEVRLQGLTGALTVTDALGGPDAQMRDGVIPVDLKPLQAACYVVPMD